MKVSAVTFTQPQKYKTTNLNFNGRTNFLKQLFPKRNYDTFITEKSIRNIMTDELIPIKPRGEFISDFDKFMNMYSSAQFKKSDIKRGLNVLVTKFKKNMFDQAVAKNGQLSEMVVNNRKSNLFRKNVLIYTDVLKTPNFKEKTSYSVTKKKKDCDITFNNYVYKNELAKMQGGIEYLNISDGLVQCLYHKNEGGVTKSYGLQYMQNKCEWLSNVELLPVKERKIAKWYDSTTLMLINTNRI